MSNVSNRPSSCDGGKARKKTVSGMEEMRDDLLMATQAIREDVGKRREILEK